MFPREPHPRALDRFEILERIGSGGVGEVFLARSRGGKLVAIKAIAERRGEGEPDRALAQAFAREASVCARLHHPCIVQVRALIEDEDFVALVFEYVPGVALARVLRVCQAHGLRLPERAGWHVVERVLTALAYAHGMRGPDGGPTPIVHRDVSPSNVLLDWGGGVKIADFGIAKVLGVSPATRVGLVKGTPGCMAPEQARGEAVDERADVYAAGLLAWRLATGRVPFAKHQNDEIELLRAMRNPRIKPLASIRPDLPEPLLDAVARSLEPEPERRTITAGELADAVRAHVDVGAGRRDLASLLEGWKEMLEQTIKHAPHSGDDTSPDAAAPVTHTARYEEVALAFDEDGPVDGPTLQAHALPSDPALLAALPHAERAARAARKVASAGEAVDVAEVVEDDPMSVSVTAPLPPVPLVIIDEPSRGATTIPVRRAVRARPSRWLPLVLVLLATLVAAALLILARLGGVGR